MLYLLPLLVSTVSACSPGTGSDATLLSNPTFSFTFNPPVGWTYFDGAVLPTGVVAAQATPFVGQKANQADAQRQIQNDLDNAILKAMYDLRITAYGIQYSLSGYAPQDILVRGDPPTPQAGYKVIGTYVPQSGAVVAMRTVADVDSGTPNQFNGVIRVSGAPLATRGQWKTIAGEVYKNLYLNANVKFLTPITVS